MIHEHCDVEMELAIACRIAINDPSKAVDAIRNAAFNVGIRSFGMTTPDLVYKPAEHEYIGEEPKLPGDSCTCMKVGWKTNDNRVLLRAMVV